MKAIIPILLFVNATAFSVGVRLKDLATIRGVKENQLLGYGLVVGLPGSGDREPDFTEGSLTMALKGLGIDPKTQKIGAKNAAAVVVSATLPAFSRVGGRLDVTVSSIGSASSLEGGTLMMTPLKGADGRVYAVAQGRIVVSRKERGTSAFQAMLSAAIPQGAILEKDVGFDFSQQKDLRYQLINPDFTTAARISQRINEELGGKYATPMDPGTVDVILPYGFNETPVDLVAKIESIEIEPDRIAKVVVNRKTGTVVLGDQVKVYPMSLAHANLRVVVKDEGRTPQELPAPDAAREPGAAPTPEETIANARAPRSLTVSNRGTSIAEIVTSLNEVGATPDDIVFLVQSMKSTGSLVAELELQ